LKVELLESFIEDLEQIGDQGLTRRIIALIDEIEVAKTLLEISHVKKLKGRKTDFRIRVGDHRLGFRLQAGAIVLVRCLPRKDFYRSFP
jgi:mRNA interferase RelE/StbE